MIDNLISESISFVSVGLFDEDRLVFLFVLSVELEIYRGKISVDQLDSFLRKKVSNSDRLNDELFTDFERLIFIRSSKFDEILPAIRRFVERILDEKNLFPAPVRFESIFERTNSSTPILFLLSTNSDPIGELRRFAARKFHNDFNVSLRTFSSAFEVKNNFNKTLQISQQQGTWIFLENFHLFRDSFRNFQQILFSAEKVHVKNSTGRTVFLHFNHVSFFSARFQTLDQHRARRRFSK